MSSFMSNSGLTYGRELTNKTSSGFSSFRFGAARDPTPPPQPSSRSSGTSCSCTCQCHRERIPQASEITTTFNQLLPFCSLKHDASGGQRYTIDICNPKLKEQVINYIKCSIATGRVIVAETEPIYYDMLNVSDFGDLLLKQRRDIEKLMENKLKYGKREHAIHDLHRIVVIKEDVRIDDVFALEERMITAGNLGISVICLTKNTPDSWKKKAHYVFLDAVALKNLWLAFAPNPDLRDWIQGQETIPADYSEVISLCAKHEDVIVIQVQSRRLLALTTNEMNIC